jgi:hypothetical protein
MLFKCFKLFIDLINILIYNILMGGLNMISDMSKVGENLRDTEFIKKATKASDFKNPKINKEVEPTLTINDKLLGVESDLNQMGSIINDEIAKLTTNVNVTKNLTQASNYYKDNLQDIEQKIDHIVQKEKLNNRISKFYNSDYEFKKTLLYYLNKIYFVMIVLTMFFIIYTKKHKEKKIYGFLFLLIVIPYFLIGNMYKIILNNLGHLKIDVLYIILLSITGVISFGLFFVSKIVLKKKDGGLQDILKDPVKTLKSKSNL